MLRHLFFLTVLTVTGAATHTQWQPQNAHTAADLRGPHGRIATLRDSALQRPTN